MNCLIVPYVDRNERKKNQFNDAHLRPLLLVSPLPHPIFFSVLQMKELLYTRAMIPTVDLSQNLSQK